MAAVLVAGDLPWEFVRMLEAFRCEQAVRVALQREAEEQDRADWIWGIRCRLGLVSEVHTYRTWEVGAGYWAWVCERRRCREGGAAQLPSWHFGRSKADVTRKAREHVQQFVPPPPEPAPGAGLDLTGFRRTGRGLDG